MKLSLIGSLSTQIYKILEHKENILWIYEYFKIDRTKSVSSQLLAESTYAIFALKCFYTSFPTRSHENCKPIALV